MIVGMRKPVTFFVTSGAGVSDVDEHTGSFHNALEDAGIAKYNIMKYSSILPKGIKQIKEFPEGEHGAVMETIMSEVSGSVGDNIWAGISWGMLQDSKTNEIIGGIVVEFSGKFKDRLRFKPIRRKLDDLLDEVHRASFFEYKLVNRQKKLETLKCTKVYGTALVALCFVTYEINIIGE